MALTTEKHYDTDTCQDDTCQHRRDSQQKQIEHLINRAMRHTRTEIEKDLRIMSTEARCGEMEEQLADRDITIAMQADIIDKLLKEKQEKQEKMEKLMEIRDKLRSPTEEKKRGLEKEVAELEKAARDLREVRKDSQGSGIPEAASDSEDAAAVPSASPQAQSTAPQPMNGDDVPHHLRLITDAEALMLPHLAGYRRGGYLPPQLRNAQRLSESTTAERPAGRTGCYVPPFLRNAQQLGENTIVERAAGWTSGYVPPHLRH